MPGPIPELWLPKPANVQRVILHWSGGGPKATLLDRSHYHFCANADGTIIRGLRAPGQYLQHTRNLNTGSVGLSLCGMGGAVEGKSFGKWPLTSVQVERACEAAAQVLKRYGLSVTQNTCLCHSEVTHVYGKIQRGKWDIDCLQFRPDLDAAGVHVLLRRKVLWYYDRM